MTIRETSGLVVSPTSDLTTMNSKREHGQPVPTDGSLYSPEAVQVRVWKSSIPKLRPREWECRLFLEIASGTQLSRTMGGALAFWMI